MKRRVFLHKMEAPLRENLHMTIHTCDLDPIKTQRIYPTKIHSYCRTCLKKLESSSSSNEVKYDIHQTKDLAKWIVVCTSIEVNNTNCYPNYLCQKCFSNFQSFYNFRLMCIQSMKILDTILDKTDNIPICDDISQNENVVKMQQVGRKEDVNENPNRFVNEILIDHLENTIEDKIGVSAVDYIQNENDSPTSIKSRYNSELDLELNMEEVESWSENVSLNENNFSTETVRIEEENSDTEKSILLKRNLKAQLNNCEIGYSRVSYLKTHIRKIHQDSGEGVEMEFNENDLSHLVEQSQKKSSILFQCELCTKRYYSKESLDIHMQVHQGLQRFQCSQCERSYKNASHLRTHIREIHQRTEDQITCSIEGCGKQFKHIRTYRAHYRIYHTNFNSNKCETFICEDCGRIFKHFLSLKNHRFKHASVEEYPFKCDQCGKGYTEKRRYKQHILGHTAINKKYSCTYCGVKKSTRSELLDHINCHTKENQWPCPHCPSVFNSSAKLGLHDRVVHNGVRRYACRYCEQRFTHSHTLKYHEMRHTGEKPHECHICKRRFRHVQAMRTHLKTHNKVGGTNSTKRKKNQSSHTVTSEEATNLNI